MRIGMIGLGRMGANMVRRLLHGGHECVAYDRSGDGGRFESRGHAEFANKLLSAMRLGFGGHVEQTP